MKTEIMGDDVNNKNLTCAEREQKVLEALKKDVEKKPPEEREHTVLMSAGVAPVKCHLCGLPENPEQASIPHVMLPVDNMTRIVTLCGWCVNRMGDAIKEAMAVNLSAVLGDLLGMIKGGPAPEMHRIEPETSLDPEPENVVKWPGKSPKWEM